MFHKIGQAFGYQDIDFDAHPQFSKQYILKSENEEIIRNLFTSELIALFENEKKISAECSGYVLIIYRGGKRIAPDQIYEAHDRLQRIYLAVKRKTEFL